MKKIITLFLCTVLILSMAVTASATSGTTTAQLSTTGLAFDIDVPLVLPINVDNQGNVSESPDAKIINNSLGMIKVTGVSVTPKNDWQIASYDTVFSQKEVDLKEFGLMLNGDKVNTDGTVALNGNWSVIEGNKGALPLVYEANVASQSQTLTNVEIATIVFTMDWSK